MVHVNRRLGDLFRYPATAKREFEAEMVTVYILKEVFISWMIGHASTLLLRGVISISKLPQLNFIGNEKLNKLIGVGICKWVLANSFIKYFNRGLQMPVKKPNASELLELRDAMTYAEIVHLIAFAYVIGRVLMNITRGEYPRVIVSLLAVNNLVNLYPALVQQMNKRRIGRLIQLSTTHNAG